LRDAPLGALICTVLLIVYDLALVTTPRGHQFDGDAFFDPKALSRKIIRLDSDILDLVKKAALWLATADAAKKAGITRKQNVLRHSFCSYGVALRGLEWTADQADHDIRILRRNYREVVSRQEAEAYFRIGSSPIPAISS
jgi:hypothetical protein